MSVLAILLISGVFVLAAMAGVADAIVCFAYGAVKRARASRSEGKPAQPPAQGITA